LENLGIATNDVNGKIESVKMEIADIRKEYHIPIKPIIKKGIGKKAVKKQTESTTA
jgi:hypothetical protein